MALVYGGNNALGQTLQQAFDQDTDGVVLDGKTFAADRFTFNGKTRGNFIVFEETFLQNQQLKTLNVRFPGANSGIDKPVAEQMMGCCTNTSSTCFSQ